MTVLPPKLSRYAAVASLFLKYGRGAAEAEPDGADALARDLESLGPTFVKMGQLLSTRADLLPPACLDALARLQAAAGAGQKISPNWAQNCSWSFPKIDR